MYQHVRGGHRYNAAVTDHSHACHRFEGSDLHEGRHGVVNLRRLPDGALLGLEPKGRERSVVGAALGDAAGEQVRGVCLQHSHVSTTRHSLNLPRRRLPPLSTPMYDLTLKSICRYALVGPLSPFSTSSTTSEVLAFFETTRVPVSL